MWRASTVVPGIPAHRRRSHGSGNDTVIMTVDDRVEAGDQGAEVPGPVRRKLDLSRTNGNNSRRVPAGALAPGAAIADLEAPATTMNPKRGSGDARAL